MRKAKNTKTPKKKLHVRKGDTVLVISGNEKGNEGEVLSVDVAKNRAIVEGLNLRTRNIKGTAQKPEGSSEEFSAPIHLSNLKVVNPETGQAVRTGRQLNEETGKLERYFKAYAPSQANKVVSSEGETSESETEEN